MSDCIFCKIVNGEAPCYKIYEDDYTLAFLDIAQKDFGHTLVIPKKHCINTLDCQDDILQKVILTVKKVAKHYVDNCNFDSALILNANNENAGQVVFHLHYHIVPKGDKLNRSATMLLEEQQKQLKI